MSKSTFVTCTCKFTCNMHMCQSRTYIYRPVHTYIDRLYIYIHRYGFREGGGHERLGIPTLSVPEDRRIGHTAVYRSTSRADTAALYSIQPIHYTALKYSPYADPLGLTKQRKLQGSYMYVTYLHACLMKHCSTVRESLLCCLLRASDWPPARRFLSLTIK